MMSSPVEKVGTVPIALDGELVYVRLLYLFDVSNLTTRTYFKVTALTTAKDVLRRYRRSPR